MCKGHYYDTKKMVPVKHALENRKKKIKTAREKNKKFLYQIKDTLPKNSGQGSTEEIWLARACSCS